MMHNFGRALIRSSSLHGMASNKAPFYCGDGDSGVASKSRPNSQNGSPIIEREDSRHALLSVSQLTEGVVVYSEHATETAAQLISSDTEKATGEESIVVPMQERQGLTLSESNHGEANFCIGETTPEKDSESGVSEQSGSKLLLRAKKAIDRENEEKKSQILHTEAKLKNAEVELKEKEHQLAEAEAKNTKVELQLRVMTKKKEEAEKKLEEVQDQKAKEMQKYKDEVEEYKKRLAYVEKKNETQRLHFEHEIEKLTKEMEEKEKTYDTHVFELTQQTCDLKVNVADMRAEEQSLKRQIAELQRDLERQAKENLAEKLEVLRSSSETALAKKDDRIQTLERLLSEASLNSNSSQDNN